MAAETDNTEKKPKKVELIKRSKEVLVQKEQGEPAPKAEPAVERKKVIIIKKRQPPSPTPAPIPAELPAVAPKVTVVTHSPEPVVEAPVVETPAAEAPQKTAAIVEAQSPAPKIPVPQTTDASPPPAVQAPVDQAPIIKSPAPQIPVPQNTQNAVPQSTVPQTPPPVPAASQQRSSGGAVSYVPPSQRPAIQAGKVGGKFFGPKRPSTDAGRNDNFRKPAAYVGRNMHPGTNESNNSGTGRPMGNTPGRFGNSGGGFQPHPGQPHTGGGYTPHTGGYQPRPGGYQPRPGGYQPRPGGYQGGGGGFRPGQGGQRPGGFQPRGGAGHNNNLPPPLPLGDLKTASKRTFKAKKPVYKNREKELEKEEKLLQTKKRIMQIANPVPKTIDIMEVISVSELARKMNLKASDLIAKLMSMGMMVTINQQIDSETATILASEFGADVNIVSLYDETLIETESDDDTSMLPRPPVVTVMGHVDHGKTKLLDAIRSSDVVSGEFGGITQHIGAYMVETPKGNITFLDTPGHEAFTKMRSRGAQVTDIVVLVVAADDGVMPQTIEALNHAKEAKVPIIVAINKIDKPDSNPERIKSQLADMGLQPEEWGGDTMFVQLSALKREGIDKLIDAILLQAEILDLKSNYNRNAEGKILESRIDHGRGIVATIIVERGTLVVGDSFVAGIWPGKVRAIFNDKGQKIEQATPAMPVEVLGFEGIPNAGDPLQVVEDEKTARGFSSKRQELKRFEDAKNVKKITLDNLYDTINDGEIQELKVIIKGDVQGSVEALRASLEKLSTKEVRLNVIQALPGAINEGDVDLAAASNAILIGFNVRPTQKAKALADQEKVDVRRYNIIYKVVEEIQQAMEGMLKPDKKEEVIANVEVRNVFKISKYGVIAGCYVLNGTVKRSASLNIIRDNTVIHTGKISSLRRFKDDVKEVGSGFECGMSIEDFDDVKEGDEFEIFEMVEVARKLS
ncbi:MAG: translation initiation factor IF-2 [Spirochaetaceae bacterium]|jgi:translation initiation factor IF-2|nr:translation initiation factor IF-2 [Spirochaetaceae bacterium]